MTTLQQQIHWWLDEADRLDKQATELDQHQQPVANVDAMDDEWIAGTLGPIHLRRLARAHRERAALLARKANQR